MTCTLRNIRPRYSESISPCASLALANRGGAERMVKFKNFSMTCTLRKGRQHSPRYSESISLCTSSAPANRGGAERMAKFNKLSMMCTLRKGRQHSPRYSESISLCASRPSIIQEEQSNLPKGRWYHFDCTFTSTLCATWTKCQSLHSTVPKRRSEKKTPIRAQKSLRQVSCLYDLVHITNYPRV